MIAQNLQASEAGRSEEGGSSVESLLARQAQLQRWIDALDGNADGVPPHVVQRVRSDYQTRLAGVVDQLAEHHDALEADAQRLRGQLEAVRAEREHASDQLAEGRLRNRLGEWSDEEWSARRAELDQDLSAAIEKEQEWAAELDTLERLLSSIGRGRDDTPQANPPRVEPPIEQVGEESDLFSTAAAQRDTANQLDFSAPIEEPAEVPPVSAIAEAEPDTRPGTGVKCPECGYTNDSAAWYCGVCGVDLA